MTNGKRYKSSLIVLLLLTVFFFFVNISVGSVLIPLDQITNVLIGNTIDNSAWAYIITDYRLPKAITAVLTGIGLSVCGLVMQTFFRNPLAGPYVLGLSSGSSLGVALVVLSGSLLPSFLTPIITSPFAIIIASSLGSFAVLVAVLAFSNQIKDTTSLLVVGLMFSSFTGAVVGVLSFFSSAEQLQKFTLWSLGSIGGLSWNQIFILSICSTIGLLISLFQTKSLNSLLLGESYAISMGLNMQTTRLSIIGATSILTGSITAFVGPIAFIGLAVPHMAKLIFQTSNHFILFWGTLLLGAITLLICDGISQLPGFEWVLPINAITSIIGAPIVIWLLVRKKTY